MKLVPYEHLRIKTKLNAEEARKRLDNVIEPIQWFRWFEFNHKPYQGIIEGSHFKISRIIHYRNSFLPNIKGEIQSDMTGCSIDIRMYPHGLVIAFMIFWLGGVGSIFLGMLGSFISSAAHGNVEDFSTLLIPGGMFAFGYIFTLGGFKFESIRSKKFFRDLFQSEEVEEMGIVNPFGIAG